jgi:hypothetical protein
MVIGNNPQVSLSLFAPQYTMAAVIAQRIHRGGQRAVSLGADSRSASCSFIITLIVNVVARLIWSMARQPSKARMNAGTAAREDPVGALRRRCGLPSSLALVPLRSYCSSSSARASIAQSRFLPSQPDRSARLAAAWPTPSSAR